MTIARARIAALAATAVVVGLGGGCGSGESRTTGAAEPDATAPSDSSSPGETDSSSPSPEPSESSPASPSVELPDGPVLRTVDGVSIRVPRGFDDGEEARPDRLLISIRESDLSRIRISTREQIGEEDFERLKEIAFDSSSANLPLRVQPDREILGEPAFHFAGPLNRYQRTDEFGVVVDGIVVSISFWTLATNTPAQRAEVIEPVLASIEVGG